LESFGQMLDDNTRHTPSVPSPMPKVEHAVS
jgi:hypothetical protein